MRVPVYADTSADSTGWLVPGMLRLVEQKEVREMYLQGQMGWREEGQLGQEYRKGEKTES